MNGRGKWGTHVVFDILRRSGRQQLKNDVRVAVRTRLHQCRQSSLIQSTFRNVQKHTQRCMIKKFFRRKEEYQDRRDTLWIVGPKGTMRREATNGRRNRRDEQISHGDWFNDDILPPRRQHAIKQNHRETYYEYGQIGNTDVPGYANLHVLVPPDNATSRYDNQHF